VRALLIANWNDADSGFVGDRFRSHGFAFDECHREHPGEWPDLAGHDLVVLLGSDWSVYWPQVAAKVAAEVAVVQAAAARGVPVFGVCFGSQILAHALGGSVVRAAKPEIGWYQVESDAPEVIATGPWLQWHYDVVRLPSGAAELARSEVGPQAWQLGRSFSTQFHPEATESMVRRWSAGGGVEELARRGVTPEALLAETLSAVERSRPHSDRLVDWFLETVGAAQPTSFSGSGTDGL